MDKISKNENEALSVFRGLSETSSCCCWSHWQPCIMNGFLH